MIDLSQAPEGATHYTKEDENNYSAWWKKTGSQWYSRANKCTSTQWIRDDDALMLIPIQKMITVKYIGEKPTQGSDLAAGYDVRSMAKVVIHPSAIGKITTTTKIQMPDGYSAHLMPRSSICDKNGLILINSIGQVDPDYTGYLIFNFWNLSAKPVTIDIGERIGQAVFHKRITAEFVKVDEFAETKRGDKGFGSTGKF